MICALRWQAVLAVLISAVLFASCTPDLSKSSAMLLVPTDETYRSQWQFEPIDGPNNYHVFVHWDPSFNPDIDTSLTVVGYQVSDLDQWTGEPDTEDALTAKALRDHARDVLGANTCEIVHDDPEIRSCEHDVGQAGTLLITSRVFATSSGPAAVLVPGPDPARAIAYLSGDFDEVAPSQAAQYLH